MARRKFLGLTIGGAALCCSLAYGVSTAFAQHKTVTVFSDEWAPYNYLEAGVFKGIAVEVLQDLLNQLETTADFVVLPGMRALTNFEKKSGSLYVSLFRTKDRENKYQWVGPIISSSVYFYKRAGSPLEIKSLEDAKRVDRVASRQSGLVHRLLKKNGFTNLEDTAKNGWEVYRKLLAGRSDLGISDSPLGVKYVLKSLGQPLTALIQTPVKILDMELYIAVHKSVPSEQVAQWQAVLDRMKASGRYDQIIKKYSE
ncbi:substrate-binding periplasmic protein [Terasakiella pusilla]|uniref:substrate-binding periplasmic protein n=1 Tax=Terasakiella pusilla TaxID=64973 RepID=UPI00048D7662|nr:transporter substrate-binding domain-containing protein [Terasakiella pusilla]